MRHSSRTATIETNLHQGDLGVEVDIVKGDLAETENPFSSDERQKRRANELRSRSLLWPCDSTGGCAQSSPFFCSMDEEVQHVCTFFTRKFGYAHNRQATMILQVSFQIREKEKRGKEKKRKMPICNCRIFFLRTYFFESEILQDFLR